MKKEIIEALIFAIIWLMVLSLVIATGRQTYWAWFNKSKYDKSSKELRESNPFYKLQDRLLPSHSDVISARWLGIIGILFFLVILGVITRGLISSIYRALS